MVSIAILGYGTVGKGVAEIIEKNEERLKKFLNEELVLNKILIRDKDKHIGKKHFNLLTDDFNKVLNKKVDIVIETMGGLHPAYDYVKKALLMKKSVITANKDLIAEYGHELIKIAHDNGVEFRFEASVGGGIPILKPLSECLMGNTIESIIAILNGTTNFILSKMNDEQMEYSDALKIAQEIGFAEANPDSDVLGYDSARKLSILSTIAFSKKIHWRNIKTRGINDLDKMDIMYAQNEGLKIKLLAISKVKGDKINAFVSPVLVREDSLIGKTNNENNTVIIKGDSVGDVIFTGKGAGMFPTASSVFSDIVDILQKKYLKVLSFDFEDASIDTSWGEENKWLLRVETDDRVQTMKKFAELFSSCDFKLTGREENKNEVAVFVKCKNEAVLNKNIKEICESININKVKKLLVLED